MPSKQACATHPPPRVFETPGGCSEPLWQTRDPQSAEGQGLQGTRLPSFSCSQNQGPTHVMRWRAL